MNAAPPNHVRELEDSRHLLLALLHGLVQRRPMRKEEMDAAIAVTLRKVADMLQPQLISVVIQEANGSDLSARYTYISPTAYRNDESLRKIVEEKLALLSQRTIRDTDCTCRRVIESGKVRLLADQPLTTCFDSIFKALGFRAETMAAAPFKLTDVSSGCVVAINKCPEDQEIARFSDDDAQMLDDVATHIGKLMRRNLNPTIPVPQRDLAVYKARLSHCEFLNMGPDFPLNTGLLKEIGKEPLRQYLVLPLEKLGEGKLKAVVANPQDHLRLADFQIATGFHIVEMAVATEQDISDALHRAFPGGSGVSLAVEELAREYGTFDVPPELTGEQTENSAPIVRLANRIIEDAYTLGASDIHVEPAEQHLLVRYRIDGVCREKLALPKGAHAALIARLKIMSDLDIAEHRLPQDGRIVFKKFSPKFDLDLRVSVVPANHGESIVMRILDKTKSTLPLSKLGFSDYNLKLYRDLINIPYGMILHCGPTGSGKSMTLYAALNEINSPDYKIMTAEDPIEYTLPRIIQVQIKKDIGLTFASALRCFLRQDPDIILVGEIRDQETAEIAVEASLTGHVLFSTLHTNDACSTITRLVEIGIDPFLISTTLACICAQRLMRRLCTCKVADIPNQEERALLERALNDTPIDKIWRPQGCPKCDKAGYKGRTGVHELLRVGSELREMISRGASAEQMKVIARRNGMRTLFEDAMEKVKAGITTMPEALNTARPDEEPVENCAGGKSSDAAN